jgi:hypothetical protein
MPRTINERITYGLLIVFPLAFLLAIAAVGARVVAARPARVWLLAVFPLGALLLGPRSRAVVLLALGELAALLPLHALVTLLRAARLEGG